MSPREYKLLFAGPMGAGKTTAIAAISDSAPVTTEAHNSDRVQHSKTHTTVAFDYGEVALEDGNRLRLYGMPGQSRFDFMWKIASEGALGVILLLDAGRPAPIEDLALYVRAFESHASNASMVIGLGRGSKLDEYSQWLTENGLTIPLFTVDVRRRDDVLLLLDALLNQVETRELLATNHNA